MLRRQSFERPGTFEFRKSRSTSPSIPAISRLLLLCATSHPFLTQSGKLIFVTDNEQFLFFQNTGQEMIRARHLRLKFLSREDRGVYVSSQRFVRLRQCQND